MPIDTILLLAIIGAVIGLVAFLIRKGGAPDWFWLWDGREPLSFILFRTNGKWRKYSKVGFVLAFVAFAAAAWFEFL